MKLTALDENTCRYTDTVVIEAGAVTTFACWYARGFYHHRQKQWKQLLTEQLLPA